MNREEMEDHLSSVVLELDTNKIKVDQIKELNKQIAENEAQLTKSLIKIPFIHKTILDNLGIIKHHVPTLLEQNKQLVNRYNLKLKEAQLIEGRIVDHLKAIREDYTRSSGQDKAAKKKLIDSYFDDFIDERMTNYG
jgi:hypothetical protein